MNTLIVLAAQYLIFVGAIVTAGLWLTLPKDDKISFAVRFVVGGVIAFLLSKGIAYFYFDPRPFVVRHATPLFAHAPDNGFPSDHTVVSMLAALVALSYSRRVWAILVVFSLLIGTARVLALVHSPIDIIGAVAIAAISVGIAGLLLPVILRNSHGRASAILPGD